MDTTFWKTSQVWRFPPSGNLPVPATVPNCRMRRVHTPLPANSCPPNSDASLARLTLPANLTPLLSQWGTAMLRELGEQPYSPESGPPGALFRERFANSWLRLTYLVLRRQVRSRSFLPQLLLLLQPNTAVAVLHLAMCVWHCTGRWWALLLQPTSLLLQLRMPAPSRRPLRLIAISAAGYAQQALDSVLRGTHRAGAFLPRLPHKLCPTVRCSGGGGSGSNGINCTGHWRGVWWIIDMPNVSIF